jgi:hypothetical protein
VCPQIGRNHAKITTLAQRRESDETTFYAFKRWFLRGFFDTGAPGGLEAHPEPPWWIRPSGKSRMAVLLNRMMTLVRSAALR